MTELKTLKDLKFWDCLKVFPDKPSYVDNQKIKKKLRQEAIKWIKKISSKPLMKFSYDGVMMDGYARNAVRNWIKHFFNITEEDLK